MTSADLLRVRSGPLGLLAGASAVLYGARRVLAEPALRRLALVPMALTAALYALALALGLAYADELLALAWARPEEGPLRALWLGLVPLVALALFAPLALLFSALAGTIGGPFYDRMALLVLRAHGLEAEDPGFLAGTLPDLLRSLTFAVVGGALAALALVPVVGVPFAFAAAAVAWLAFGSAAINPTLTVTGRTVGARLRYTVRHAPTLVGLGAVVACSLLVPLLVLLALPAAVVGAAELYARTARAERATADGGPR